MARFEVRFLKDVCNDVGHPRCVLQRIVVMESRDALHARDEACVLFCAREKVGHWRDHADRIEVVEFKAAPGRA